MDSIRKIPLGDTGLSTTVIGYGCAGLMRPGVESERLALVAAAFDVGIRHFDVARYYGYGLAESVLGKFVADTGCRDQITITTKFGMEPPAMSGSSRGQFVMSLARRVASIHPAVRKILSARANAGVKKNCFDVGSAQTSLETSLRELRTDCIDLFLLHEATLEDSRTEGLLEFLEEAKSAGKIRAFGLGSDFPLVPEIIARNPVVTRIVQIANRLGQWNRRRLPQDETRLVNTHGALKILPAFTEALHSASPEMIRAWKDVAATDSASVAGLLLGLALHDNPQGITLFSSVQPERIRSNIAEALRHESRTTEEWIAIEQAAEALLDASSAR